MCVCVYVCSSRITDKGLRCEQSKSLRAFGGKPSAKQEFGPGHNFNLRNYDFQFNCKHQLILKIILFLSKLLLPKALAHILTGQVRIHLSSQIRQTYSCSTEPGAREMENRAGVKITTWLCKVGTA